MPGELELFRLRLQRFGDEVIAPAVYTGNAPLDVGVLLCGDPIPWAKAVGGVYEAAEIGLDWGPPWSTAWFRLTGTVPAALAGSTVALHFSSGTEALLWRDGVPHHGLDRNHDTVMLHDPAMGGEPVELHVEAACHHAFGTTTFHWDPHETQRRWRSPSPGRLEHAELVAFRQDVWRLHRTWRFACELLGLLPEDDALAQTLARALRAAARVIDDGDVAANAAEALGLLDAALTAPSLPATSLCFAVGHAHIDTAWLWPLRDTKRKCLRTFATVLRLMERCPDFIFLCSQAQQYHWVREASPALFEQITARVLEGRWEPSGAMWIEPDGNLPSGESFVRQILFGTRFWARHFGDAAPQRMLYLPDTFGFTAALPQIMALSGLDTFVTNKLSWNQVNEFPHVAFRWRGIDGTEVVSHCTPGHDYNALNTPTELRRGAANAARQDRARTGVWLQPFGFGDGGGGPTDWNILNAQIADRCPGLPSVKLSRSDDFCAALHERIERLREQGDDLPVWDGELYLELHRGTLTTHGWLKHANRRAEIDLRAAEWLHAAAPGEGIDPDLTEAWSLVLLNQFHDILPGSSVTAVYDDARHQHERVRTLTTAAIDDGVQRWAAAVDTTAMARPIVILNPGSTPRGGVVECEGELHVVDGVPALGMSAVDRDVALTVEPVRVTDDTLSNGIIKVALDDAGRIGRLLHVATGRDACPPGSAINQLVLYEDRPRDWEAWDIDPDYVDKAYPVDTPIERSLAESNPLRSAIEVRRSLGRESAITQRYVLAAGSPRIDVWTRVEWRERRRLLRALFPVNVRSRFATYEIQFGHLERPAHRNTSWEQSMFEVCAHTWMDLSEHGFGVALLNDGKYGHSCDGNLMGLSLLRGSAWPDPSADIGTHEFTYSIMPHGGDWRAAGVDREAHALNAPLIAVPVEAGRAGWIKGSWAPFELTGEGVVVSAVKRAEDGSGLIVRLAETHGGRGDIRIDWRLPVENVEPTDLLERPMTLDGFTHDQGARRTRLRVRPFQIVTLAATL